MARDIYKGLASIKDLKKNKPRKRHASHSGSEYDVGDGDEIDDDYDQMKSGTRRRDAKVTSKAAINQKPQQ
jgi:hypothetical protein